MKYNKEVLDLSRVLYKEMGNKEEKVDNETSNLQNNVMNVLLRRFIEKSLDDENNNGLLKVNIKDGFWKEADEGFELLDKLYKENKIEAYLKDYNMYLSREFYVLNEKVSFCYKIIWDYKAYFESLIPSIVSHEFLKDFDSKNRLVNSIAVYRTYPVEKQQELINIFFDYVLIYLERQIGFEHPKNRGKILSKK